MQTRGQDRANKIIGGGLAQIAPKMLDILMVEASFADRNGRGAESYSKNLIPKPIQLVSTKSDERKASSFKAFCYWEAEA